MKRFHAIVRGKVQGVFYRASAHKQATTLGLIGFVRNLTDGSVELEAQGEDDVLERFLAWCHKGPPAAKVEYIETVWKSPSVDMKPLFRIES